MDNLKNSQGGKREPKKFVKWASENATRLVQPLARSFFDNQDELVQLQEDDRWVRRESPNQRRAAALQQEITSLGVRIFDLGVDMELIKRTLFISGVIPL